MADPMNPADAERKALEREFVGGRLVTGSIAAEGDLVDALWAKRYMQDVPRLLDEVERLRQREAAPYACPVCLGVGKVANGFYNRTSVQTWLSSSTEPESCRSCGGTGVLWRSTAEATVQVPAERTDST